MSAYVVNDETISVIAKGIIDYGIAVSANVHFDTMALMLVNLRYEPIGQWLLDQNYASVNARYDEHTKPRKFKFIEDVPYDEGKLYGCIRCYEYQACETHDYDESDIHNVLTRLKEDMLSRIIEKQGMEIPWGMD